MVEQTAVNRQATGSSPVSPASGRSTIWMSKWIQQSTDVQLADLKRDTETVQVLSADLVGEVK